MSKGSLTFGKVRFESFSDGVFAIAITLLVLEIHLPSSVSRASGSLAQAKALLEIWPAYLAYTASFATIGIMWLNHHALFDASRQITHGVIVANFVLLGLISFLPFPTEVLGQFGLTQTTIVYYGITMTAISFAYLAVQIQVFAAHPDSVHRLTRWNIVGLTTYPLATVVGFFVPLLGLVLFGALAVFYAMPHNVRLAKFTPAQNADHER